MAKVSYTSIRRRLLFYLTALALFSATLPGCVDGTMSNLKRSAEGEAGTWAYFYLSSTVNAYEITRWWNGGDETFSVPRSDLPTGCGTARFFPNDSIHELQIAHEVSTRWMTGVRLPLPDDSYPPCALLVSYGFFSEPQALEGVAVTSAAGLVAASDRKQPNPAAWAQAPANFVAENVLFLGMLVTLPVWGPVSLMAEAGERQQDAEAKGAIPPPVAACWTAIVSVLGKGGTSNPHQPFDGFEWVPGRENSYVLATVNEAFSVDEPVPIDARLTLSQGRLRFPISTKVFKWTDADVECGLQAGEVVATSVKLRK